MPKRKARRYRACNPQAVRIGEKARSRNGCGLSACALGNLAWGSGSLSFKPSRSPSSRRPSGDNGAMQFQRSSESCSTLPLFPHRRHRRSGPPRTSSSPSWPPPTACLAVLPLGPRVGNSPYAASSASPAIRISSAWNFSPTGAGSAASASPASPAAAGTSISKRWNKEAPAALRSGRKLSGPKPNDAKLKAQWQQFQEFCRAQSTWLTITLSTRASPSL